MYEESEIKYPNQPSYIIFQDFTEVDLNIFFILCEVVKYQRSRTIRIHFEQMRYFVVNDKNKKRFYKNIVNFTKKLNSLKAQKSQIDKEGYEIFSAYAFFEKISADEKACMLTIKITESSLKLINDITSCFTSFEVREFCFLNNKYAKNLYRLLKPYQAIGIYIIKYACFKEMMSIPKSYQARDIDRQVLKPAILKLTQVSPYTHKPYFENLTYTKIKSKSKGQGGSIDAIAFSFVPRAVHKARWLDKSPPPPPPRRLALPPKKT